MRTQSSLKHARISAQKARLVADQVRGAKVERALELMEFSNKKASVMIKKLLNTPPQSLRTLLIFFLLFGTPFFFLWVYSLIN